MLIAVAGLALVSVFLLVLIGVLPVSLRREEFAFAAFLFVSLAFLNTWDSPIYLALLLGVLAWGSRQEQFKVWAPRILTTGLSVGAAAILLFLPWYPSFASQAAGVVANLMFPTKIQQFGVMFGVSLVPIVVWLIWRGWGRTGRRDLIWKVGLGIPFLLLIVAILFGITNYLTLAGNPILLEEALRGLGVSESTLKQGLRAAMEEGLLRRLLFSGTALVLGLILGVSAWLLATADKGPEDEKANSIWPFTILLIGIGARRAVDGQLGRQAEYAAGRELDKALDTGGRRGFEQRLRSVYVDLNGARGVSKSHPGGNVDHDVDALEQDRVFHLGKAVHSGRRTEDRSGHLATRDDRPGADDAVVRLAPTRAAVSTAMTAAPKA